MSAIQLPSWLECKNQVRDRCASNLERFIYDNEPGEIEGGKKWREFLAKVIEEAEVKV